MFLLKTITPIVPVLFITACSTVTYLPPITKNIAYDNKTQARIHFSGSYQQFIISRNTGCYDASAEKTLAGKLQSKILPIVNYPNREIVGAAELQIFSIFPKISSQSIGMPAFDNPSKNSLPFYEIVVQANEPITILSSFGNGSKSCHPDPTFFVPEAGADYETSIETRSYYCFTRLNQIIKDNTNNKTVLQPVKLEKTKPCG